MPTNSLPKPRIFISHSAHELEAETVLDALVACLKTKFDVLVDRQRLIAGQEWRDELFHWMHRVHGAVILFSSSALKSDWVRTEASVLSWRRALDRGKSFTLIPVLLSPVTPADLDAKEFSPMRLSSLQLVQSDNATTICNKALAGLQSLLNAPVPDTPLEKLGRKVAYVLRNIEAAELLNAARAMGTDLTDWSDSSEYATLLAREMLERGLPWAMRGIRELDDFLEPDETRKLVELIAPVWVSMRAASTIPQIAAREDYPLRRLWVNGGDIDEPGFTAKHFVRRACCRTPDTCWPVLHVPPHSGEDDVTHYKAVIHRLLKTHVVKVENAKDSVVKSVLTNRERDQEPIFVAFSPPGPDPQVMTALRAEFPTLTFFIMTGGQSLGAAAGPVGEIQFLEPHLRVGEEEAAFTEYITAIGYY